MSQERSPKDPLIERRAPKPLFVQVLVLQNERRAAWEGFGKPENERHAAWERFSPTLVSQNGSPENAPNHLF